MERVIRGRSFTLSKTFYSDGVATTPGSLPTVAIVRADGTTVPTSSVSGTGAGPYTATVTAANNTTLNTLTVTWTALMSGQSNTYIDTVEVAGGSFFSIAEAKATSELTSLTVSQIEDLRTSIEQAIENYCGMAFVPRYAKETLTPATSQDVITEWPLVRTVRAATLDGTALDVATITPTINGLYASGLAPSSFGRWPARYNLVIEYEHGMDEVPLDVSQAALRWARQTPSAAIAAGQVTRVEAGEEAIQYATPSTTVAGRAPLPDVQATLDAYKFVPVA